MSRIETHYIHEGPYVAELAVTTTDNGSPWAPIVAKADVFKADRVRLALRRGDVKAASMDAKVYELTLLAGE